MASNSLEKVKVHWIDNPTAPRVFAGVRLNTHASLDNIVKERIFLLQQAELIPVSPQVQNLQIILSL